MRKFSKKCFEESGVLKNLHTLFRGFRRVLSGAAVATTGALGVYGFTEIPVSSGYNAVLDFMASVALLVASGYFMWLLGGGKVRAGAFEK